MYINSQYHLTNVYVIDQIPAFVPYIDVARYPHLRNLSNNFASSTTDILIGQDNHELLIPYETKIGKSGEPFAFRTLLGWSLCGPGDKFKRKGNA